MNTLATSGALTTTFRYTQNLIAACPTFAGEILGDVSFEQAKGRVYLVEALSEPDELAEEQYPGFQEIEKQPALEPRPYALVIESNRSRRRSGTGEWSGEGASMVCFEVPVPKQYQYTPTEDTPDDYRRKFRDRKTWADNLCGQLLDELSQRSGGSDGQGNPYLNANDISVSSYPGDPEDDEAEDYIGFSFLLNWV